jgi:hypothetical protein
VGEEWEVPLEGLLEEWVEGLLDRSLLLLEEWAEEDTEEDTVVDTILDTIVNLLLLSHPPWGDMDMDTADKPSVEDRIL